MTMEVLNPATGETMAEVPESSVEDVDAAVSEMPHGSYKQSAYGKDLSMYSLEDYTQVKHVMFNNAE